jgi:hypothetical protein
MAGGCLGRAVPAPARCDLAREARDGHPLAPRCLASARASAVPPSTARGATRASRASSKRRRMAVMWASGSSLPCRRAGSAQARASAPSLLPSGASHCLSSTGRGFCGAQVSGGSAGARPRLDRLTDRLRLPVLPRPHRAGICRVRVALQPKGGPRVPPCPPAKWRTADCSGRHRRPVGCPSRPVADW